MRADDLKIDVFGNVGIATFILDYSFDSGGVVVHRKERSTLVFVKDAELGKSRTSTYRQSRNDPKTLELAKLLDCACLFWRFWFNETLSTLLWQIEFAIGPPADSLY